MVLVVKETGGSGEPVEPEPAKPASMTIQAVDADGEPVPGVEFYLRYTEVADNADIAITEATDEDGKVVYQCGNDLRVAAYEILPTEDSGYSCETPVKVTFGYDSANYCYYVATIDGQPYEAEQVVTVTVQKEGADEPEIPQEEHFTAFEVQVADENGPVTEEMALVLKSAKNPGEGDISLTASDGKATYHCTGEEATDDTYKLLPADDSGYTCESPVEITFGREEDKTYVAFVGGAEFDGKAIQLMVSKADEGDEGDEGDEPSDPSEYHSTLYVKVVDEKGEPVKDASLYLKYNETLGHAFSKATDADGKAAYTCGENSNIERDGEEYKLTLAEGSKYVCEEPAIVIFEAEKLADETWITYIDTVNGKEYAGEEITLTVKSMDEDEPDVPEPSDLQTTMNIKVVDADNQAVEGVKLSLVEPTWGTTISIDGATDKDGHLVYTCGEEQITLYPYHLQAAEDSGYTTKTGVKVTLAFDEESGVIYIASVDDEAYEGGEVVITVEKAAEDPDEPGEPEDPDDGDEPENPDDGDEPENPDDGDEPENPDDGDEPGEPTELPFEDVNAGTEEAEADWFYDYVAYVYENGLMTGLDETTFGPNEKLARAQMAVILYRLNGSPEVEYTDVFSDVPEGIWYADAVIWAQQTGVVTGYTDTGEFKPNQDISRQEITTMMYRYAEYKEYSLEGGTDFDEYPDAGMVAEFAKEAMSWAVGNGIISGKTDPVSLDPQGVTFRSECAAIMMRFVEAFGK